MTILNKRNAVLGWSVWQVAKAQAKRKAKQALPLDSGRRPGKGATLAGLAAAAGGAVLFWRRRGSRNGSDEKS